jgi:hypothetical protein
MLAKSGMQSGLYRATNKALMSMARNTLQEHVVSEAALTLSVTLALAVTVQSLHDFGQKYRTACKSSWVYGYCSL